MKVAINSKAEYDQVLERVKATAVTLYEIRSADDEEYAKRQKELNKLERRISNDTEAMARYVASLGNVDDNEAKKIADRCIEDVRKNPNWRCSYMNNGDRIYVRTEYACHDHYHSAYESCDSCGNCSGARCCDWNPTIEWTIEDHMLPRDGDAVDGSVIYRDRVHGWDKDDTKRIRDFLVKYYTGLSKLDTAV